MEFPSAGRPTAPSRTVDQGWLVSFQVAWITGVDGGDGRPSCPARPCPFQQTEPL